jgi:hypothetical protein
VLASFRRAVYVEVGHTVLVLVTADAPPGPVHLRVRELPRPEPNAMVALTERTLAVGDVLVDMGGMDGPNGSRWWRPPHIDANLLRRSADAARRSLIAADGSDLADHPELSVADSALQRCDLSAVVAALAGLGAGLTPAGDDVLAGLLVVLATAGHDEGMLREAVAGVRTHAISRAFLTWAARGQGVEPVHLLLAALSQRDHAAARRHQDAVLALGHTSGADLLLGLRLGLGALAR